MTTQFEILTKTATDLCTLILSQQQTSSPISSLTSSLSKSTISPSETTTEEEPPTILAIRSDFIQLSTHLGKECTSLTLACKPPLSLLAVEGTLKKIIDLLKKFEVCLGFCPCFGALSKEIRWIAYELTEAIQRLLESSLECHKATTKQKSSSLRTLNLTLTGQVWEKVTLASTSLSTTELESTRKEWKSILELLDDCLEEVKEMEEDNNSRVEDEGYGEDEDEDEDEDDYRNSHPLSEVEKERVKAAHMLLRLGRLLLKRLITSTAPIKPSSSSSSSSSTSKTLLPSTSTSSSTPANESPYSSSTFLISSSPLVQSLSSIADDLAGSLEPPQILLSSSSKKFEEVGLKLSDLIESLLIAGEEGEGEELKWLKMWRDQVCKARVRLDNLGTTTGVQENVVVETSKGDEVVSEA